MNKKVLPRGISDYKKLIQEGYYYVDKTLLIDQIEQSGDEVVLITRPRRFGKSLNLSMLRYFYEATSTSNKNLFADTAISTIAKYQELQGKFPVIFISFKDVKVSRWDEAKNLFAFIISQELYRHYYLVEQENLKPHQKELFLQLLAQNATDSQLSMSLHFLSSLLYEYYKQPVIVLLDEYDTPVVAAYTHGYYKELINFMRVLLPAVLKDNPYLKRSVIIGIVRVAKEGIFSGLNNLGVYSPLHQLFSESFGFTQKEVDHMLGYYNLTEHSSVIKNWYNGYMFGQTCVYNPWSVISCCKNNGALRPYWANTSDNVMVKKLIASAQAQVKLELELLLSGVALVKEIDETLIFHGIEKNEKSVWNFLYYTGYVTSIHHELVEGKDVCGLMIPNKEITVLYKDLIRSLLFEVLGESHSQALVVAITEGDSDVFTQLLQQFIKESMSVFDIPDTEPEKSYHLFVLGLLVMLGDSYEVKSNRESGFGRYDIMLIPKDTTRLGIIIEFKKVQKTETFDQAAERALQQIVEKQYSSEMNMRGISLIKAIGIACSGKKIFVLSQDL